MLLESLRSTFSVITAKEKAVSNLWLEVRSFETFSFLDRRRLSTEKVNMFAAILNYTEMKVLHFKRKLWLQVWFPSVPNGLVVAGAHYSEHPYQLYPWVNPVPYLFIFSYEEKTSPHIFL